MAKFPLDLKHFKKSKEDKNSTTLLHKDGHQINIVHSALSPEMQSALSKLPAAFGGKSVREPQMYASGGKIPGRAYYNDPTGPVSQDDVEPIDEDRPPPSRQGDFKVIPNHTPEQLAQLRANLQQTAGSPPPTQGEGPVADTQDYGDTTNAYAVNPTNSEDPSIAPPSTTPQVDNTTKQKRDIYNSLLMTPSKGNESGNAAPEHSNDEAFGPNGEPPKAFNPNVWQQAESTFKTNSAAKTLASTAEAQKINQTNEARLAAGLPPVPNAPAMNLSPKQGGVGGPTPAGTPDPADQPPKQKSLGDQMMAPLQAASSAGYSAADAQEEADRIQGQAADRSLKDNIKLQEDAYKQFQGEYTKTKDLQDKAIAELSGDKGQVDPKHYVNNMSTMQKMGTVIGLIGGGMFSATTGQQSPALAMLQNHIQQDIDAQVKNIHTKASLVGYFKDQIGSTQAAQLMATNTLQGILKDKLLKAATDATDPQARARYFKAAQEMLQVMGPQTMKIGAMQMAASIRNETDPKKQEAKINMLDQLAPEIAAPLRAKLVPGIGVAAIDVDPSVREGMIAKQQFLALADEYKKLIEAHPMGILPLTPEARQAQSLGAKLTGAYREATHGGVYKQSEQHFIEGAVPSDPGKFMAKYTALPQIQQLIKDANRDFDIQKSAYGLPTKAPIQIQKSKPVL